MVNLFNKGSLQKKCYNLRWIFPDFEVLSQSIAGKAMFQASNKKTGQKTTRNATIIL